jgi:hypothetical protein
MAPHVDHALVGDAPKDAKGELVPHLALRMDQGAFLAVPPGAMLAIVENPERYDGVIPVILLKVSRKELVFRCGCGNGSCTRVGKFKAIWKGVHPHREETKSVAREG